MQGSGDGAPGTVGLVRWASVERAHSVRPYSSYRKARRHLPHYASEATFKLRGQVVARLAERQRRFIAGLKTRGWSQDTFVCARATAAATGR